MTHELLRTFSSPLVFGHRGFSSIAPENTLSSIQACIDHGVQGVELDVQPCASGELVVIHDDDVSRVTGAKGIVKEMPLEALRSLDAGSHFHPSFSGERIPLLDEVFSQFGKTLVYDLEIKSREIRNPYPAKAVWELIRKHGIAHRCIVSSYNPFQVRFFERISRKQVPTAVIFADDPRVPWILRRGWGRVITNSSVIKPHYPQLTPWRFWLYRNLKGCAVITWTVDDPELIRSFKAMGVWGIITNNPKQAMQVIATD